MRCESRGQGGHGGAAERKADSHPGIVCDDPAFPDPEYAVPESLHGFPFRLHELAINALKHGALSVQEGRVSLTWAIDGDVFRLNWRESRGPAARASSRRGFGTRLIDMGLGDRSTVTRDYGPTGLEVCIVTPIVEMR